MPASLLYHLDSCSADEGGECVASESKPIVLRADSDLVGIEGVRGIEECQGDSGLGHQTEDSESKTMFMRKSAKWRTQRTRLFCYLFGAAAIIM